MKKLKKLVLLICVLTLALVMTACGEKEKDKTEAPFDYKEAELVNLIVSNTELVSGWSKEEIDSAKESYDEKDEVQAVLLNGLEQIYNISEEAGEYVGFYKNDKDEVIYELNVTEDSVIVSTKAKYKERDVKIEYVFGLVEKQLSITSIKYEGVYSLAEKMKTAGLNTLTGMGVVVVVLAFLSVFISLFNYVNKAEQALANKKNGSSKSPIDSTITQIETKEEIEEEVDDLEVIAVITAAIAAMEQTTTDGFVVRSIKRVPQRKWNRGL